MVQQTPNYDSLDKFNELINKATEAVMCGPDCQKEKTASELKQKYLNSKTNLKTAPGQVQVAAKNYYMFTTGESGYNEYREQELTDKAEQIITEFKNNFDGDSSKLKTEIDTYNGLALNFRNVFDLYTKYKLENDELEKELKDTVSDILTNDRKTFYEDQSIENLNYYYSFIRIFYIIVAIGFSISLFFVANQISFFTKIAIIILLSLYPYISTRLLSWVIQLYYAVVNLLPKNMYRPPI
jgi:hypothetical protein